MVAPLSKENPFKSIRQAAKEAVEYIDDRRSGKIKSLRTPWSKWNDACMGGIEWHTITTVAGMSGSGKTAIINQLETGLKDLNKSEDFAILSFNWEMLAMKLVGRKLSNKLRLTTSQLFSGDPKYKVDDNTFRIIQEEAEKLSRYDITYVELPGTVDQIVGLIRKFVEIKTKVNPNKGVIVFMDHVLLVNGKDGDLERQILFDLMTALNRLKKEYKISFVILSQLNRAIEDKQRILQPELHFPTKGDLFGSDSMYQFSDLVIVAHRPEILNIFRYGPQGWDTRDVVFLHFIKVREGQPFIGLMKNNLKYNEIIDG